MVTFFASIPLLEYPVIVPRSTHAAFLSEKVDRIETRFFFVLRENSLGIFI